MQIFLVVLMYGMWSSVFSLGKLALESSPPIFLTAFRMLFAAVLLIGYLAIRHKQGLKLKKSQIVPLLLFSFLSIYLTNILEFWGLKHLSAAKTCFIYGLSPFFAVLLSYFHFKEKINVRKFIGLVIGFIGFIPVVMSQMGSESLHTAFSVISWPEIAVMGAAFFSIYGWIILRILVKKQTLSPITVNGYGMLFGGFFALIHSFVADPWMPTPIAAGHYMPFFQGVFLMALVSNIICYNLYGYMLKRYTATFLSFMGLLSPVFASINSYFILGEKPSMTILVSTLIVSLGLFIVYQAELKQGYILSPSKEEKKTVST
ncbi:EamA family transporter [Candidatus Aerophobetes bacterium]|uniref:EamA family transporter n=1 Tax=Aerophobetes bacterium TaxID=2030807 RepID=A0A2A4X7P3_UNCAE|nr:MAG: EamA family transporter [Candidatus Aerophobetes bacterium]